MSKSLARSTDRDESAGRRSVVPAYHRLTILLIDGIKTGRFPPGSLLPSENVLAEQYGVSRVTVRRALQELVDQGIVTKHHGHGTLVRVDAFRDERTRRDSGLMSPLVGANAGFRTRTIDCRTIAPSNPVSVKLGLPAGSDCVLIRRIREIETRPISYAAIYLPLEAAKHIAGREYEDQPVIEMLEDAGIGPVRAEFNVSAGVAEGGTAELLDIAMGSPVLAMRSVAFDDEDRPVYYQESVYDPDRYEYSGRMRRGEDTDGKPCWIASP